MPDFLSCIATVVVKPGWLGRVAHAQHAAPELSDCLEAACEQDPTFVLRGEGSISCSVPCIMLAMTSLFCLLRVVSMS